MSANNKYHVEICVKLRLLFITADITRFGVLCTPKVEEEVCYYTLRNMSTDLKPFMLIY